MAQLTSLYLVHVHVFLSQQVPNQPVVFSSDPKGEGRGEDAAVSACMQLMRVLLCTIAHAAAAGCDITQAYTCIKEYCATWIPYMHPHTPALVPNLYSALQS